MDNPPQADYPHFHTIVVATAFLEFYCPTNLKAAAASYSVHYLSYVKALLGTLSAQGSFVFSIDGSTAGRGCMVLMFSAIYQNRAIPVVWTVVKAKKGHLPEQMHQVLLARLADIVPTVGQVTVVGDGKYEGYDWQANFYPTVGTTCYVLVVLN